MKKRLWFILLMICMMISLASAALAAEADLVIHDETDLRAFAESVNAGETYEGKTVVLETSITLTGEWTPIGTGTRSGNSYTGNAFKGTFNGGGNTISGLTISTFTSKDYALGLFGVVDGGKVSNLELTDVNINVSGSEIAGGAIGLLTGGGTADEIIVSGSVSAKRGNGGIVGRMLISGTISNCTNYAAMNATGGANLGGIVGAAYYTAGGETMSIAGCNNYGAINGSAGGVGGIVGLSSAHISDCTNTADVNAKGASVGGIVGEQQNYGSIIGCTNSADVTVDAASSIYGTGGIVGWIRYSGADADYPLKGVVEVKNNTNSGAVVGANDAGGIVGTVYHAANVSGNTNTAASLTAANFAAGIVGNFQFTDTLWGGPIPQQELNLKHNVSTTAMENITANCTGEYVYDNSQGSQDGEVTGNTSGKLVARIGSDKYTSLQAAIDEAGSGDTITILDDVELTNGLIVAANDDIILDLNGMTVSMVRTGTLSAYDQLIENFGSLRIKDSSPEQSGALTYKYTGSTVSTGFAANTITNKPGASLFVTGGTIENLTTTGHLTYAIDSITNGSVGGRSTYVSVTGGTIKNVKPDGKGVALRACLNSTEYSNDVTILKGTLIGGYAGFQLHGISNQANKADVLIEGGRLEGGSYSAYSYFMGADGSNVNVTINKGEFSTPVFFYNPQKGSSDTPFGIEILDGQFESEVYTYTKDADGKNVAIKSIKGGTFVNTDSEDYLADGYGFVKVTNNGQTLYRVGKTYKATFNVTPEDATIEVMDYEGNIFLPEADGKTFIVVPNDRGYKFTLSREGYVSITNGGFMSREDIEIEMELLPIVNAQPPLITAEPENVTCTVGEAVTLTVTAESQDDGELTYQWYSQNPQTSENELIEGATEAAYQPDTNEAGTAYYYCEVTNTKAKATGEKTASVNTAVVTVTVTEKVNAQLPVIVSQTSEVESTVGDTVTLTVTAESPDGGKLSFQWFRVTEADESAPSEGTNENTGSDDPIISTPSDSMPSAEAIEGANANSYTFTAESVGTVYYYCDVTNTNTKVDGATEATISTDTITVIVKEKVDALPPVITAQPESVTCTKDEKVTLTVTAKAEDDGELSYQWYMQEAENKAAEPIEGATEAVYEPSTKDQGKVQYYCVVTNTNANATGSQTAAVKTDLVTVTVNNKVNAKQPVITGQPVPAVLEVGNTTAVLTVKAISEDEGVLSYQWFRSASEATTGGTKIEGAAEASYKPATDKEGKFYYYCVVTNTKNEVNGEKTASVTSAAAAVTVKAAVVTHVADITVIGQKNASYTNVHATLRALGENNAVFEEQTLTSASNASAETEKYVYHSILEEGLYNLIVEATEQKSGKTVTVTTLVHLEEHDDYHTVNLPEAEKSSVVKDESGLGIIAGNVDIIATYQEPENEGGHLEVKLTVDEGYNPETRVQDEKKIEQKAEEEGKKIEKTLDIDLTMIQYTAQDEKTSEDNMGDTNTQLIEIIIPIETENRKAEGFSVYRVHNGVLHELPYGDEYFVVDIPNSAIKLYVKRFSSYAIGYGEKVKPAVTLPAAAQTVSVTEGDVVTLTVAAKDAVSYQWYINCNDGNGWQKRGENSPSYTSSPVTLDNNGYQYKCVVTSADHLKAESPIFTLEVVKKVVVPQTGDNAAIGLWLVLMCVSLTGIAMIQRKRRTQE